MKNSNSSFEKDTHVRTNLKMLWYSENMIHEVIDTITAVDKQKKNLSVEKMTHEEKWRIAYVELVDDRSTGDEFREYIEYIMSGDGKLSHKQVLEKYKSNICKYIYMVASKDTINHQGEEFIRNNFGTISRTDQVLVLIEQLQSKQQLDNALRYIKNNPIPAGYSIDRTWLNEEKINKWLMSMATWKSHSESVI
jgi:hypothetical protein